jgi:hypothetical protein
VLEENNLKKVEMRGGSFAWIRDNYFAYEKYDIEVCILEFAFMSKKESIPRRQIATYCSIKSSLLVR